MTNTFFKMENGQEYANKKSGKVGTITLFPGYDTVDINYGKGKNGKITHRNYKIEDFLEAFEIHIDPKGWEAK